MTRKQLSNTTGYKYYGFANSWGDHYPDAVRLCKHEEHVESLNTNGTLDRYYCPVCKFYYDVDSSG